MRRYVMQMVTAERERCAKLCEDMGHKINTGDCFEPGQVWMAPRGTLWRVLGYEWPPIGPKQAVLRMGAHGKGRKQKRDWDAVDRWVIYTYATAPSISHGLGGDSQ